MDQKEEFQKNEVAQQYAVVYQNFMFLRDDEQYIQMKNCKDIVVKFGCICKIDVEFVRRYCLKVLEILIKCVDVFNSRKRGNKIEQFFYEFREITQEYYSKFVDLKDFEFKYCLNDMDYILKLIKMYSFCDDGAFCANFIVPNYQFLFKQEEIFNSPDVDAFEQFSQSFIPIKKMKLNQEEDNGIKGILEGYENLNTKYKKMYEELKQCEELIDAKEYANLYLRKENYDLNNKMKVLSIQMEDEKKKSNCFICGENKAEFVLVPCGHFGVCKFCVYQKYNEYQDMMNDNVLICKDDFCHFCGKGVQYYRKICQISKI